MKTIKIIILTMLLIMLCGCNNKKCIKSHEEQSRCVWFQYIKVGDLTTTIPHYYDCIKEICDEYEKVEVENED